LIILFIGIISGGAAKLHMVRKEWEVGGFPPSLWKVRFRADFTSWNRTMLSIQGGFHILRADGDIDEGADSISCLERNCRLWSRLIPSRLKLLGLGRFFSNTVKVKVQMVSETLLGI
jgi:hypothetical protein